MQLKHSLTPALVAAIAAFSAPMSMAQGSNLVLEEIVVTAQKKAENLSETPMTVNVITGETFSEYAGFDIRDLDRFTAGIAVTGLDFDVDMAVRGLGSNLDAALDPRVTFYWDNAYSVRQIANFVSQFDLERFELLRGPQGTLYGKSSPAGALTMQTRSPNLENVDGFFQQAFSERDGINSQLAVSLPIVKDTFGIRLAGVYDQNRNQDIENITLGINNQAETKGGRVVALWQASDNIDVRFSYNYVKADKDINSIVEGNGLQYTDRKAVNEFAATSYERHSQAVLEVNWELPNEWLLTSVTSHQRSLMQREFDSDQTDVKGQNQSVTSDIKGAVNQELRLQSVGNDFWDWTAGIFYQDSEAETPVYVDNFVLVGLGVYLPFVAEVTGPAFNDSEEYALFLHNAFHITENGTLTLGLRYNNLERYNQQTFEQLAFLLAGDERVGPLDTTIVEGVPEDVQNLDYDAFTGTLKYQHSFADGLMVYGSYDRGWRSGSANIGGQPLPADWAAFEEESSDNFELGMKWSFMEGRGLFNLTGYYQTYEDFHYGANNVLYVLIDDSFAQGSPVVNADEVSSTGVEAEVSYLIMQNWSFSASMSYNKTKFEQFDDAPCNDPSQDLTTPGDYATCDLKGEPAGTQPEWSGVITSEYYTDVGDRDMEWYLRGLFKAEGEREDVDVDRTISGYAFVDVFTGLRSNDGAWDVSLWAKNLLDEEARLNLSPTIPVPDYALAGQPADSATATINTGYTRLENLLAPRTIGATLALRF
ncbi:TonB-dependent receptor [Halieaceae bacterium IMCC14734]|uniref:TonB-dependent receptor n=1 Tax=Candidatus Litorirhabdus singularis TaxID=2518993 RepID=A0ABT3TDQ1_9GAMM|nr:TonB-dependent receptor [Candidatus Litorirhabdus singularis]MCX2980440.1 TonB-dependent receptor [Candidatus Litorirhabdus singularis]